jgi:hypothetical protein
VGDVREPRGKGRRAVRNTELLHSNYFNIIKVARVKWPLRLRFVLPPAMPCQ